MEDILIVTRNFPPLIGGMEGLMEHAVQHLSRRYACTLIGPRGCEIFTSAPTVARGCREYPLALFLFQALFHALACASRKKYRFALAGSGITAPVALILKSLFRIPVITFVHGLDLIAESWVYQQVFVPAIRRSDLIIANSNNTARLAVAKGINSDRVEILFPGVDIFEGRLDRSGTDFRKKYGLMGKKILLSVGRLVPRKGLAEFLRFSFPFVLRTYPQTVLVIIGNEAQQAIKREGAVRRQMEGVIDEMKLTDHVLFLGWSDEAVKTQAYLAADLFIFPIRQVVGDVEGFGMVALEAAAHGLPTAGFAIGGVSDAVRHQFSGYLVEDENYQALAEIIVNYLSGNYSEVTAANCREFAAGFSWEIYGQKLITLCNRLITKQEKLH
jgi:phosphatidylinositol alpha-1,6-mannosyltransferase